MSSTLGLFWFQFDCKSNGHDPLVTSSEIPCNPHCLHNKVNIFGIENNAT